MVGTIKKVLFACKSFIIYKNQAKLTLLHNTFNNQPQEPFWSGFKTTGKRMRIAALQYANGQVKHCDDLIEASQCFISCF